MIVHDAAAAAIAVYDAAVMWVQVIAGALAMVLCAIPLCVAPGVRAARRGLRRRQTAEQAPTVPEPPRRRHVPSWAHTEPYTYEEAA